MFLYQRKDTAYGTTNDEMWPTLYRFLGIRLPNASGTTMKRGRHFVDVLGVHVGLPTACGTTMKHDRRFIKVLGVGLPAAYDTTMYMSYLLPVVEYASVVWDRCSERDSQTLQKIQNEAARLVTGLTRSVSLESLYKECGWLPLSQIRQQHMLSSMYNVNAGLVPTYISNLIPSIVNEISDYPLRSNRNISLPYNRTNISQKPCIPPSIRLWNGLEDDFKNLIALTTFIKHVISKFNKSYIPSYFTFGNRYISVLHARLKNRCSNLINDLYINHIHDKPLCDLCGVVEDAIHYFFHCRRYTIEIQGFKDTVRMLQPISIYLLLFGNENWNLETNIVLFRAVQRYIQVNLDSLFENIILREYQLNYMFYC